MPVTDLTGGGDWGQWLQSMLGGFGASPSVPMRGPSYSPFGGGQAAAPMAHPGYVPSIATPSGASDMQAGLNNALALAQRVAPGLGASPAVPMQRPTSGAMEPGSWSENFGAGLNNAQSFLAWLRAQGPPGYLDSSQQPAPQNYPMWPTPGAQGSGGAQLRGPLAAPIGQGGIGSDARYPTRGAPQMAAPTPAAAATATPQSRFVQVDRPNAPANGGPFGRAGPQQMTALDLSRLFGRGANG